MFTTAAPAQAPAIAPPPTDLGGGTGLGAITAAGLAAIISAVIILVLKKGGNDKYASKFTPEVMLVMGFCASAFFESAGWGGPGNMIRSIAAAPAASWGWGACAIIVTAFALLRRHKKGRAVVVGFTAATLYAAAGGWWNWPGWLIHMGARQIGLAG
ncbi:hypothetical protein ACH4UM_37940 [Streptomyces sp. NPDC020801]|uniref:hypothetical protein n=1 Tax=Streptomyces sp. NPDC020801 TaxID=3365093 RepID=UPI0037BDA1EE